VTRTQARRAGHGAAGTAPAVPAAAQPFRRRVLRRRKDQWAAWAFLLPVTAYLLLFYAYPLYNVVVDGRRPLASH
jgi:multiple sugar transport system permease protein